MVLFTFATLLPVPLLALGAASGGIWVVLALVTMTGLTFTLDELVKYVTPPTPESEFPAADALSVTLAVIHFPLFAWIVWGLAGDHLSVAAKVLLFLAAGLYFGQVGNSNAHELIHRGSRALNRLGRWVYISLLFGHHVSAHVLVHHRFVATENDPNSARLGENYYRYALRAWRGSFVQGYRAEAARLGRVNRSPWRNPYVLYVGGGLAFCLLALFAGGITALIAYVLLALYSQAQLLLSDYVQHYGLSRAVKDGKPEPVGHRHSWNAPHWFSSGLMLNAPRHSDHHAHPSRAYPSLELPQDGPMLPRSLPAMASLALFPAQWRRVMDKRAAKWAV